MRKLKSKKELITDKEILSNKEYYLTFYSLVRFVGLCRDYFKIDGTKLYKNEIEIEHPLFIKDTNKKFIEILKRNSKYSRIKIEDNKTKESLKNKILQNKYNIESSIQIKAYETVLNDYLKNIEYKDKIFILEILSIFDILEINIKNIKLEAEEIKYLKTTITKFNKYIRNYLFDLLKDDLAKEMVIDVFVNANKQKLEKEIKENNKKMELKKYILSSSAIDYREEKKLHVKSCIYVKRA